MPTTYFRSGRVPTKTIQMKQSGNIRLPVRQAGVIRVAREARMTKDTKKRKENREVAILD